VAGTQQRLLLATLKRNEDTEYGLRHGFAGIRSANEYRERAPLTDYGDYAEAVERIGAGEKNVLTREEALLLEPTSGSTRATKLIPYTTSLKNEFARGIRASCSDPPTGPSPRSPTAKNGPPVASPSGSRKTPGISEVSALYSPG
jgi:hypothetical protein